MIGRDGQVAQREGLAKGGKLPPLGSFNQGQQGEVQPGVEGRDAQPEGLGDGFLASPEAEEGLALGGKRQGVERGAFRRADGGGAQRRQVQGLIQPFDIHADDALSGRADGEEAYFPAGGNTDGPILIRRREFQAPGSGLVQRHAIRGQLQTFAEPGQQGGPDPHAEEAARGVAVALKIGDFRRAEDGLRRGRVGLPGVDDTERGAGILVKC